MSRNVFFVCLVLTAAAAFGAERPSIPSKPIGQKGQLLFSDDFSNRSDLGKDWKQVVPTFTVEDGALKGTQTRVNKPAENGKPAVVGHQAVVGSDVATKDSIIEFRFKLAGATAVSLEFDDRKYTGSHYGHICFARLTPRGVIVADQKEGSMRNDIYAMTAPGQRKEKAKLLAGRSATFPAKIEQNRWYTAVVETVGDQMRVTLDGKPVAFLKSPGIGHPTKSKIELGCAGKDGLFDDIKIWSAEPAKE
jgi:hypothetical protein